MNILKNSLEELYRYFNILNEEYFKGELPSPVITIQKARSNNFGHFTLNKVWVSKNNDDFNMYEININPLYLNRPIEEIIGTLHHEMIHYFNKINDIRDCNSNIHNKKFMKLAQEVDLIVEKDEKYGWAITSCNDKLKNFISNNIIPDETAFEYFRKEPKSDLIKIRKPREKKKFKYICPNCGMIVQSSIDKHILCGDCNVTLKMEIE